MKRFLNFIAAALALLSVFSPDCRGEERHEPSGTYLFASKDGQDLFLDIYNPSEGSETEIDGIEKPTVIFIFGGGFFSGRRDGYGAQQWFKMLNESGYRVVAMDYRLGLKGVHKAGINPKFIRNLEKAIKLAVEDLYSATIFLIDNAAELGIDPASIVVSGSSAGAITALQAEWEICNRSEIAEALPRDFNYAGTMAFSGAIFSRKGSLRYGNSVPCPTMMCHGTADNIVPYRRLQFFRTIFGGTDAISKVFIRSAYNYNIFRYKGNSHEIADNMIHDFDREIEFLEKNVMKKERRIIDIEITDPSIPVPEWAAKNSPKALYD